VDYPKVKTSLYVPADLLDRARLLAERQDRTLSQVLARSLSVGLDVEALYQDAAERITRETEEYERGLEARRALMLRPAY
jgi:hypothetical protein